MAFRMGLVVLMVSLAAMAMHLVHSTKDYSNIMAEAERQGLVADSVEFEEEMMMESESARRQLKGKKNKGKISYDAMEKNKAACDKRGLSYYNCKEHQEANPYNRNCTKATKCERSTK